MKKKLRYESGKLILSMLVMAGTPVTGQCHIPTEVRKADPEVVRYYCPWSGYRFNPQISKKDWYVSQCRKEILMCRISGIRQQIRAKAERIRVDNCTVVTAFTQQQKDRYRALRDSEKLLSCIVKAKHIS